RKVVDRSRQYLGRRVRTGPSGLAGRVVETQLGGVLAAAPGAAAGTGLIGRALAVVQAARSRPGGGVRNTATEARKRPGARRSQHTGARGRRVAWGGDALIGIRAAPRVVVGADTTVAVGQTLDDAGEIAAQTGAVRVPRATQRGVV